MGARSLYSSIWNEFEYKYDFSAFSLDARYFTTQKKSQVLDARVQVYSLNLTFNGAFNAG